MLNNGRLKFTTTYRGCKVNVDISQPMGAAGGFHIVIDNRHYGQIVKCLHNCWRVAPQKEDTFTDEQKDSMLIRLLRAGLIDKAKLSVLNIDDYPDIKQTIISG